MSEEQPNPLELIPTSDLRAELCRRFDTAIFAGIRIAEVSPAADGSERSGVYRYWTGNLHVCAGLAQGIALDALLNFYHGPESQREDGWEGPV